tara:strand:- start:1199 stop:1315 length:117 start_codon:yes stop_codon:yes gene_type:complete
MDGIYFFLISLAIVAVYIFLEARPKGFDLSSIFKKNKD